MGWQVKEGGAVNAINLIGCLACRQSPPGYTAPQPSGTIQKFLSDRVFDLNEWQFNCHPQLQCSTSKTLAGCHPAWGSSASIAQELYHAFQRPEIHCYPG